jgi:hypothetical protein
MDIKNLSRIILIGGVVLFVVALIWWYVDFKGYGFSSGIFTCLYSSSSPCNVFVSADGMTYRPVFFWIGTAAIIVGGVIKLSLKQKSGDSSRGS